MAMDIRINYSHLDALGRPYGDEGILKAMDKHGLENAVLVSQMAVDADFRRGNKELFEVIKSSDRLYGYLVVNPSYPQESIQMMRSAMTSRKFVAVAFFDGASRPYPNVQDYRDILNAYRRFSKPVFVEAANAEAVAAVEGLALEFPTLKFILGSMGGDDWRRAVAPTKILNTFLETSGSFDAEKIEEAVANFGEHRVLFGSNLPLSDPAGMLALIRSSRISKAAVERILGGNARRLLIPEGDSE